MPGSIDPSTLTAFADAAAGHDGVLSDPTGDLVIKPCTVAEVTFYESANESHPEFARFMPHFMGTLQLNDSVEAATSTLTSTTASTSPASDATKTAGLALADIKPLNLPSTHLPSSSVPGTAATLSINDPGPLKGKKLDTDLHIVLENVVSSFKKPNILDLKLGARLWDDGARPEKRARLDKVSSETTSGSLGFRIAGMRVWQGENAVVDHSENRAVVVPVKGGEGGVWKKLWAFDEATKIKTYNKFYGRTFNASNVVDGFREYLLVPSAGVDRITALQATQFFLDNVKQIQNVLEQEESRMYSSSILLVYEGDPAAFEQAVKVQAETKVNGAEDDGDDEEDDDDEEDEPPKFCAVNLIDFAHARWMPGQGPDENALQGVRSTVKILEQLLEELSLDTNRR